MKSGVCGRGGLVAVAAIAVAAIAVAGIATALTSHIALASAPDAPPPVDRYLLVETWSPGRKASDSVRALARTGAADTLEVNSTRELTIREAVDFGITLADPTGVAFLLTFECWIGDGVLRVYTGDIPETASASSFLQLSSGSLGIYGGRGSEGSARAPELASTATAVVTIQLLIVGSKARVWVDGTQRLAVDDVHLDRGESLMLRAEAGKLGPVRIRSVHVAEVDPRPWAARLRYAKSIETLSLAFEPGNATLRSESLAVLDELAALCGRDTALRLRFELSPSTSGEVAGELARLRAEQLLRELIERTGATPGRFEAAAVPAPPDSTPTHESEANAERVRIVVQGR